MSLSTWENLARPRTALLARLTNRATSVAGVVALTAINALLWRPHLSAPVHMDAAGYAVAAYWWAQGDTLYDQISITRPQGIFVIYRLLLSLGLGDERSIVLGAAACCLLCALLLWLVVAQWWSRTIGFAAAVVFVCLMAVPVLEGPTANSDLFMLPFQLLSTLALIAADRSSQSGRRVTILVATSGLLAAFAFLVKPSGVAALLLVMLWIARWWWTGRMGWRATFGLGVVAAGGFFLGLCPALIHGLMTVPDRYLQDVIFYRVAQDSVVSNDLFYQFNRLFWIVVFILTRLPIVLLCGFGIVAARKTSSHQRDFLWLWLGTALLGATLGGNWFLHYFQQLAPPLALAIALGGAALLHPARHRRDVLAHGIGIFGVGQTIVLLLCLQLPATPVSTLVVESSIPDRSPIADARSVAAYVRAHTTPEERIFVTYQSPDIYYLSARRPAARWLFRRELAFTPGAFDAQVSRLADPQAAPTYIVVAHAFEDIAVDDPGSLRAVVERDYRLETVISGVPIYRRVAAPSPQAGTAEPGEQAR